MKDQELPEATIEHRRGISIIWIVPLAALIAGASVAYHAITQRGPEITITFETAEGLEAGKSEVRYKDVQIGVIEAIDLVPDLSVVECHVRMAKEMEKYLTEEAQFWVVRAQIAGGQVTGLGTLLGGAYVGMQPGYGGKRQRAFRGLDVAPVVTADDPGRHFLLRSQRAGSFAVGTPVFFQKTAVGRVVASGLDPSGEYVTVKVFVQAPYDAHVRRDSRFWNSSGIEASATATGLRIRTESLTSIVIGGIAFDAPTGTTAEPADEDAVFTLHESYEATRSPTYSRHEYYLLYFQNQSVRGLAIGAPVEFTGLPIGEVVDVKLDYDADSRRLRIPVVIDIQPERIRRLNLEQDGGRALMEHLVATGLRAQLKTGSLLTGQLIVSLDIHEDAEPAQMVWSDPYPQIPTVPAPLQQIEQSLAKIADGIEKVPFERIGNDLGKTLTLVNEDLIPSLRSALVRADGTLASVSPGSAVNDELLRALSDLAGAARALELTADQLEREPQSLLFGKGAGQ